MRRSLTLLVLLFPGSISLLMTRCKNEHKNLPLAQKKKEPEDLGRIEALPLTCQYPEDNPSTAEKTELGRLLFYDPILSGGKDIACATCHHPEFGYAENIDISIGVNGIGLGEQRKFKKQNDIPFTKRNAQSLLNTAFNGINGYGKYSPEQAPMFWDLRARSLEVQASMPIKAFEEMRGHGFGEGQMAAELEKRLNQIPLYVKLFKSAFPGSSMIRMDLVAKAVATFERTLLANHSKFDEYMRGNKAALNEREIEGMTLFMKTGCARCHNGPMLSDYKTHVLGVADNEKLAASDSGYQHSYAFRTPTLRNLRFTRPYMHSGKIETLEQVLTFYEDLHGKELPNRHVSRENLDTLAMKLVVEFRNTRPILEFLNTLNDEHYDRKIPTAVPSGLMVGGRIKP